MTFEKIVTHGEFSDTDTTGLLLVELLVDQNRLKKFEQCQAGIQHLNRVWLTYNIHVACFECACLLADSTYFSYADSEPG